MATMATVDRYPQVPRYLGTRDVARVLGVDGRTVSQWLTRYPAGSAHPCPAPDVAVGDALGWAEGRLPEWETWRAGMPGRGAGGGRPRRSAAEKPVDGMTEAVEKFERDHTAEETRRAE